MVVIRGVVVSYERGAGCERISLDSREEAGAVRCCAGIRLGVWRVTCVSLPVCSIHDPPQLSRSQARSRSSPDGPSGTPLTLLTGPRRSLSLKLSDTRVYEPQIRARLGTTSHFCQAHRDRHLMVPRNESRQPLRAQRAARVPRVPENFTTATFEKSCQK